MDRITSKGNLPQEKNRFKKQAEAKKLQRLKKKLTSNEGIYSLFFIVPINVGILSINVKTILPNAAITFNEK